MKGVCVDEFDMLFFLFNICTNRLTAIFTDESQEIFIISNVIFLVIIFRCEYHKYGIIREIIHFTPDQIANIKAFVGLIQDDLFFLISVIQSYLTASINTDQYLFQILMGMTTTYSIR